jgi:ribosome maturation factor RimP
LDTASVEERVREVAARAASERGLELVHVEFAGTGRTAALRIFIDKPGGVTHEDCSEVSTHVGTVLDVEDIVPGSYTLEVSSPGLERGLYSREDFERFAGSKARVKTRAAVNGQRNFRGRIVAVEGGEVVFDDRTTGRVQFPADSVVKANLEVDIEEEFRLAEERERQQKAARDGSPDDN